MRRVFHHQIKFELLLKTPCFYIEDTFSFNFRIRYTDRVSKISHQSLYSIMWKSKTRVTTYELRVHKLRVQIHELRVQIHELRVQIQELRVQIHELGD